MNAVILNNSNEIIFAANLSADIKEVEIAGAIAADGSPVNRKSYKVSRSQRNLKKAQVMDLDIISKREHNGHAFYVA